MTAGLGNAIRRTFGWRPMFTLLCALLLAPPCWEGCGCW
ncbi:ABC-type transporter permease [Aeromonas salmonicida]|nr:ABC-type transporter permease [Aeromonas salmonicida]